MPIKAENIKCNADEAALIRRLGKAVAVQWNALPEDVKQQIKEQAVFMHDDEDTMSVQLNERISIFLKKYAKAN